jgi:hypothetical protein
MDNRDDYIMFRLTEKEKTKVMADAEAREITASQLIRDSLEFYATFPQGFLERIEEEANKLSLPPAVFLVHMFCAMTAQWAAIVKEGMDSKIYDYAFRYDKQLGLIDPNQAGIMTFTEVTEKIRAIKAKAARAAKAGKPVSMDNFESGLVAHAL